MSYKNLFHEIEAFAKNKWKKNNVYHVDVDLKKEKEVVLDFFPYPSGIGLHVGHTLGYIATDIYSRFKLLNGKNVLHAMGYDAFGLPAEQFAIENNIHPEIVTKKNISNISKQLDLLGLCLDPARSFSTTDSSYYKWTQFIFLKLFNSYYDEDLQKAMPISELKSKLKERNLPCDKKILDSYRLAYLADIEVNWCPKLATVLSQEEVIGGVSERGGFPVVKKMLRQWVLRITKYANRLLENLKYLNWPESVKLMQENWIGLSNGFEITFFGDIDLTIFTTRPETIYGATFCAISISHPQINEFCKTQSAKEFVKNYEEGAEFGIFTGSYVVNPATDEKIPVYIADYVLPYGCAAVMGVPAHDLRDNKFALQHDLDFKWAIIPDKNFLEENNLTPETVCKTKLCYCGKNVLYTNRSVEQEIEFLKQFLWIEQKSNTKLRDWIFSRQRYWGEPFPIVLDSEGAAYALEELPVELPFLDDFKFSCEGEEIVKPLDKLNEWKNVKFIKLDESTAKIVENKYKKGEFVKGYEVFEGTRETNTMPNWAGSCWYYLRYFDPANNEALISEDAKNYWEKAKNIGCVDLYLGGAEHAVLHLLYARFWHMVLYDLGLVSSPEPFERLYNQGMILGPAYRDINGKYYSYSEIEKKGEQYFVKGTQVKLSESIGKIGKRYKNGVTPEEVCSEHSVDALRLFMMFLGPLDENKPWDYTSIKGMVKLLEKVYSLKIVEQKMPDSILQLFNETAQKIAQDIQYLKFNTAISCFNIFINKIHEELTACVDKELYEKILIIFSSFAPHLCEYLYNKNESIVSAIWPELYNVKCEIHKKILIITNNGKKLEEIEIEDFSNENINSIAQEFSKIKGIMTKKFIIVQNQKHFLVNIVS